MAKSKILIADDERPTRDVMARILSRNYECVTAADGDLALKALEENNDIVLLLTDYRMPGMNGIELIERAKAKKNNLGAIIITAFGEIDLAVEAMKHGADDFMTKPITDIVQLEKRIDSVVKLCSVVNTGDSASAASAERRPSGAAVSRNDTAPLAMFTGNSPEMERIYARIRKIAPSNASVLIEGPSGTGKELVARSLHELSARKNHPFIAVECAALSRDLMESELFGYESGAFTGGLKEGKIGRFEAADGGTLFLDEIGEIDAATQVKLLRVLETRKVQRVGSTKEKAVDFRLVTATNRNLRQMVAEGTFREDLYYRLNVIDVKMPPLKDRPGDVRQLTERFVRDFSAANGSAIRAVDPALMSRLEAYEWPGNVRQLRNIVERMVVLASGDTLTVDDLPEEINAEAPMAATDVARDAPQVVAGESPAIAPPVLPPPSAKPPPSATTSAPQTLDEIEKQQILSTLSACGGNRTKAAEKLGINRRTLHRKLKEWNVENI